MSGEGLRTRTRGFALDVIGRVERLPRGRTSDVIARQLVRCATSVGANYRAACRARSQAEFVAKLGIVEEEADEAVYGLELLVDAQVLTGTRAAPLIDEANRIVAMTVASIRTAREQLKEQSR